MTSRAQSVLLVARDWNKAREGERVWESGVWECGSTEYRRESTTFHYDKGSLQQANCDARRTC